MAKFLALLKGVLHAVFPTMLSWRITVAIWSYKIMPRRAKTRQVLPGPPYKYNYFTFANIGGEESSLLLAAFILCTLPNSIYYSARGKLSLETHLAERIIIFNSR